MAVHKTSPTHHGLYQLTVVSARDFGWIGAVEAVLRLEKTLATMNGLERFRGRFYNWYDTRDLRPLDPRYVSSVDGGNLAGHLITLANVECEWRMPALDRRAGSRASRDVLDLARQEAVSLHDGRRTQTVTW